MASYVVTGGGGFIGSHLAERLLANGHRVRILDNFSTGRRANVDAVRRAGPERLQVSTADVRDYTAVEEAMKGMDGVFHLAALGSVPRSVENPRETHAVNTDGTLNVFAAAKERGLARVVFAGSSSVYGALEIVPKHEDHPTRPVSPYGLSKLIGEQYARLFSEIYGLETVTLRYYNVFGPRQSPHTQYAAVIASFIHRMLLGEPPIIHGDGEQSRDFTYVSNVVDATVLAMEAPGEKIAVGLFNVACGGRVTVNDLVQGLEKILDVRLPPVHTDSRPGDVRHSQADITRARELLGFIPQVSFHEGLERTVGYFRAAGDAV